MTDEIQPYEMDAETETTQEFDALSTESNDVSTSGQKRKKREIVVDENGNKFLAITRRNRFRPPRTRRIGRRPQAIVRWEMFQILLTDNGLVDERIVRRTDIDPVPGENSFLVYTRLHWWSHGPKQVGLAITALLITALSLRESNVASFSIPHWIFASVWVFSMVIVAVVYLAVWIPWDYHYLVVTNMRVMLIYQPPFGLPGSLNSLFIADIINASTVDQGTAKFLPSFGNLLPKFGIRGYKILKGDSAAQDDAWFQEGIHYVPDAENVGRAIATARAEVNAVETERHEEDMDFQQRQAIATEQLLDLIRSRQHRDDDL